MNTELEDNITSALASNPALRDKILFLVAERDTYWKEGGRKEIRGHLKECKGWNTDCPQNCVLRHVHVPCTCDGWLPMELAPKDGTHILVSNDRLCTVAHYFEGDTGGGWYLSWNEYDKSSSYQMNTITKWKKI